MRNCEYSAKKFKFYMFYKYLWVILLKLSNCDQTMLFVGFLELEAQVFMSKWLQLSNCAQIMLFVGL